jgi:tetratricopeptide (TPR) repeat protein
MYLHIYTGHGYNYGSIEKKSVFSIIILHFLGFLSDLTVHHFFIIGVLYRDAGSITLSVQAYERCLQIDPDSRNAGQVLFEVPNFDLLTFLQDSCLLVYDVLI